MEVGEGGVKGGRSFGSEAGEKEGPGGEQEKNKNDCH